MYSFSFKGSRVFLAFLPNNFCILKWYETIVLIYMQEMHWIKANKKLVLIGNAGKQEILIIIIRNPKNEIKLKLFIISQV